jgi:hypothetical protein
MERGEEVVRRGCGRKWGVPGAHPVCRLSISPEKAIGSDLLRVDAPEPLEPLAVTALSPPRRAARHLQEAPNTRQPPSSSSKTGGMPEAGI